LGLDGDDSYWSKMIQRKNFSNLMDKRKRKRIEHSSSHRPLLRYDRDSMDGNYGNFMKLLHEEKLVQPHHEFSDTTIDGRREEMAIRNLESKFGLSSKRNRDRLKKEFVNDGLEGKWFVGVFYHL
jgi:hypothetical protein